MICTNCKKAKEEEESLSIHGLCIRCQKKPHVLADRRTHWEEVKEVRAHLKKKGKGK